MSHILKLGFKQNPTVGTDDCIDIGGSGNTISGSRRPGYYLKSYTESPNARLDQYGRQVRDLTIVCEIVGSSVDDAHFKFREINRYLQRTRMYFEHFSGNIPAQTDLQWHTGRAATLSFQAQNATKMVYWDVLDGQATLPANVFLDVENNVSWTIKGVTIKITVNYCNREATVILDNQFPMGDFEPPFKITTTTSDPAGGGWNTNTSHTLSTTNFKFGTQSLRWSGTGSGSFVSPTFTPPENCTVVVSFWSKGTVTGGSGTYTVTQTKNGVTSTLFTWPAGHNDAGFTQYSTAPISLTAAQPFFVTWAANAGGGTVFDLYFDGAALFRNPTGNVAPTEYFASGRNYAIPTGNVYGVRGDVEAPFVMSLNHNSGGGISRYWILGINPVKWGVDYPLLGLDLQTATGAADTNMIGGLLGSSVTGSPLTGISTFALTGPSIGKSVGGRPRKYRAFLFYASYAPSGSVAATVYITLGKDVKPYSVSLQNTINMTAINTVNYANYGLYDLGDFLYPRPGGIGIERFLTLSTSDNVAIDFTGSNITRFFLAGVFLVPAEQFIYLDLGTTIGIDTYTPIISNESTSVKIQLGNQNIASPTSPTYQASGMLSELNSIIPYAYFTADSIELEPGDTHFEMFSANGFQPISNTTTGYYYLFSSLSLKPTIIYAPRNLSAAV